MRDFIQGLPKAELHVHLEGTLEPEHILALAERNSITLEYASPDEVVAAYDFHDLPSFLKIYYAAMEVLCEEQDFYDLTMAYLERAAAQNVVYVEPFFDPQAHTARGVDFETVSNGIHRAQRDAMIRLGVESNLIMCFLRDMGAESADEHLTLAEPFLDRIVGLGLDSDDPAYFRAYLNENLQVLVDEGNFSRQEITTLVRNAFEVNWLPPEHRQRFMALVDGAAA